MQPSVEEGPRWWLWPTILSLDAPAVALLWQALLARTASVAAGMPEAVVLGSSVWLAYAGDRWIEGWRLPPAAVRTQRHRFYQRWRWPTAALWAAVLGLDLVVALGGLPIRELRAGALVLVPVVAYLLSHQLVHRRSRGRIPKEVCVALLMAGGASVFVASQPGARLPALACPLGLFVLLCFANCALISCWEDEVDRSHGETSLALQFGRTRRLARALPWVAAVLAGILASAGGPSAPAEACALAAGVLLGLVDAAEVRLGRVRARVLADVALLTPLVPLLLRIPA